MISLEKLVGTDGRKKLSMVIAIVTIFKELQGAST